MKCPKCSAELPAGVRLCNACGTSLAIASHTAAVDPDALRRKRIALIAGAVALLLVAALGYKLVSGLLQTNRGVPAVAPLTAKTGNAPAPAPVTNATAPAPPKEVLDYLAFLKDIERRRIALAKRHMGQAMVISTQITASNITAQMSEEPEKEEKKAYNEFQELLNTMSTEWQQLSGAFRSVAPPSQCKALAEVYYEVLRSTSDGMTKVGTSMAQALSGDASNAIKSLTEMQGAGMGSASQAVTDSCKAADTELGTVCSKFGIQKDFDIVDDSSGSSLVGR